MSTLDQHQPFRRITENKTTASDRQWLRMLDEAFADVSHQDLYVLLGSSQDATEILGLLALRKRHE